MAKKTWKQASKAKNERRKREAAAQKRSLRAFVAAINNKYRTEGEE